MIVASVWSRSVESDAFLFASRPARQVDEFLVECVDPILEKHQALLHEKNVDDVNV